MRNFLLAVFFAVFVIETHAQSSNTQINDKKTLIAYFSATGTTAQIAALVAGATNGDLYAIEPKQAYTKADLDWTNKESRSTLEMNNKSSRPAIKSLITDLGRYDTIYVGFPIWWNTAPTLINTFIEAHQLNGKVLIPFASSGSSSIENACKSLKNTYPKINWYEGKLLNKAKEGEIRKWIATISRNN